MPTSFGDTLLIAQAGKGSYGGAPNTRSGWYNGANGTVVNWPYGNWITASTRSYISNSFYINSVKAPGLAKGGSGGCTCATSKGEAGFLIIKY
jgi:hypothetical protein